MSTIREYIASKKVSAALYDYLYGADEFYTLILAAARFADTDNLAKLEEAWPELIAELRRRHNAPGGALNADEMRIAEAFYE